MLFIDAPQIDQVEIVINAWHRPRLPDRFKYLAPTSSDSSVLELAHLVRERLVEVQRERHKSRLEVELVSWLCDFIRINVKRGRVFDLREVLQGGSADCLGYVKLFTLLGRLFGLDAGAVEVVIDNAGRYVPHTAVLEEI